MLNLDLLILVIASVANIIIGLLTYLKNRSNLTNKLFAVLAVSLVGWTTANYITLATDNTDTVFQAINAILTFVAIENTFFFLFVLAYPSNKLGLSRRFIRNYVLFSGVVILLSIYPGFFLGYNGTTVPIDPIPSPTIGLFMIHTILSLGGGILLLTRKYRRSKGRMRGRLRLLIVASGIIAILTPLTNFILPAFFGIELFVPLSPVYTLAFASIIAYAIVSQRLFDIRSAVARSVAYVLSIGTIISIYSILTVGIANFVLSGDENTVERSIVSVILAIILAISYQSIKNFFDRVTTKLFYSDAYQAQDLISSFNKVLVSNIDLDQIISKSASVLNEYIKPEYITYGLRDNESDVLRLVGDQKLDHSKIEEIRNEVKGLEEKIVITDAIEEKKRVLKDKLDSLGIGLIIRLATDSHVEGAGYLILGNKKSGNPYTSQDIRTLEILSNELVIAIQNAFQIEEIQKFAVTLQEKVDDATRKLRQSNDKLKRMDETKDEFISMASHQLRTPLTSVKGYVSMVVEGDAGDLNPMQKKLLDQAFVSSQRMVYLIADLLNVSRLRTGKFVIDSAPTNLSDVIQGEIEQLTETAQGRGLELKYDKPKDFPMLMLDETKIRQVIMNFIDNAIYYTPKGGHIKVGLRDTGSVIEYTVTDDGLGVPKTEQHHLFSKFYRADNAKKARPDGTGLGLFMARKVIIAQGGSIIFKSTEGKGSTFGFSFDKAKLAVPDHYEAPEPLNGIKSGPGANKS